MPTAGLKSKILLLPLGSFEQHGPHLPFDTDTIIIDSVVSRALSEERIEVDKFLVAPTIAISASDEHAGFSGTLSTGTEALAQSVVAICRSASWSQQTEHRCPGGGRRWNTPVKIEFCSPA